MQQLVQSPAVSPQSVQNFGAPGVTNPYYVNYYTTSNSTATNMWNTVYVPVVQSVQAVPFPPQSALPDGFNRYVNASDLMEEFIRWLGTQDVRQGDALKLPLDLFVKWLIIRAAEQDGVDPEVTLALPSPAAQRRCLGCGQFMPRLSPVPLHNDRCAGWHFARRPAQIADERSVATRQADARSGAR